MRPILSACELEIGCRTVVFGRCGCRNGPNMPVGNAERGQKFFQSACVICHSPSLGPGNTLIIKQGPTLLGVMGRKAGTSPHFNYTQALKDSGLVWDAPALDRFLTDPHESRSGHGHADPASGCGPAGGSDCLSGDPQGAFGSHLGNGGLLGGSPDRWQRSERLAAGRAGHSTSFHDR
jgi:cytochrome c2